MQNYETTVPSVTPGLQGVRFLDVMNAITMSHRSTAEPRGKFSFVKIKPVLEKAMQSLCTQLDGKHSC